MVLLAKYSEAVGSVSDDFRSLILGQIGALLSSCEDDATFMNAALAFLYGMQPQDEMEGVLAAQLFSIHTLAMEMMARAAASDDPRWTDANVNRVDKLLRTFRETLA